MCREHFIFRSVIAAKQQSFFFSMAATPEFRLEER